MVKHQPDMEWLCLGSSTVPHGPNLQLPPFLSYKITYSKKALSDIPNQNLTERVMPEAAQKLFRPNPTDRQSFNDYYQGVRKESIPKL
jgi:hypothetical protein